MAKMNSITNGKLELVSMKMDSAYLECYNHHAFCIANAVYYILYMHTHASKWKMHTNLLWEEWFWGTLEMSPYRHRPHYDEGWRRNRTLPQRERFPVLMMTLFPKSPCHNSLSQRNRLYQNDQFWWRSDLCQKAKMNKLQTANDLKNAGLELPNNHQTSQKIPKRQPLGMSHCNSGRSEFSLHQGMKFVECKRHSSSSFHRIWQCIVQQPINLDDQSMKTLQLTGEWKIATEK
jgi:hypothetical protein